MKEMPDQLDLPVINGTHASSESLTVPARGVTAPSRPGVPGELDHNLGTRPIAMVRMARYPDAGPAIRAARSQPVHKVDVLLVNPPSPDGAIWIRSQHRVGRRSRE